MLLQIVHALLVQQALLQLTASDDHPAHLQQLQTQYRQPPLELSQC